MKNLIQITKTSIIIFAVCFVISLKSQEFSGLLVDLPIKYKFTIKELETDTFFKEKYLIKLKQPVDPENPSGPKFEQRIYISHLELNRPVVFITEGYAATYAANPKYINELSGILNANQICVEHRFFGESVPKNPDWNDLTIYNAASDHHRIVEMLKNIYKEKWVNTGISKGGQTTMYHRYFYPDDVDISVGYVCPLNFSNEDKRVYKFLENVGDSNCRNRILQYQVEMLKNKAEYLPEFDKLAQKRKLTYKMGLLQAYELTVFEYSFAFWQWGVINCDSIPVIPKSPYKMVRHLDYVAGIGWISNEGISRLKPFFYQALAEIGFYGYDITPFKGLVSYTENPTFDFSAPEGISIKYDPEPMREIDSFIRHEADNMIFIYGENDPWSATSVDLTYNTNSIKIVKPGGSHLTRINNLPEEQKKIVIEILKEWLK